MGVRVFVFSNSKVEFIYIYAWSDECIQNKETRSIHILLMHLAPSFPHVLVKSQTAFTY